MAALPTAVSTQQLSVVPAVSASNPSAPLISLGDSLPDTLAQANYHRFVRDIAFYGLGSAAISRFLSVFAIRLGATPTDLSLIAALPALALLIGSTFGVRWMRHFSTSRNAHRVPSMVFRLCFLLPLFALFMPPAWQPAWIIISVSLPALMQGLAGISFTCLLRDGVRSGALMQLLSVRSMTVSVTQAISAIGFGVMLQHVLFPLNYALMFIAAWVFQCLSDFQCASMQVLPQIHPSTANGIARPQSPWRSMKFRQVALVVVITHIAFLSINAILPLYMVRKLGADEGFIAVFGLIELGAGAAASLLMTRVISRIGYRTTIAYAMAGTAISALVMALTPSLPLALIAALFSGASWTTVASIGLFGFLNESTPSNEMAAYSTAYHQVVGLAAFIAPLIGGVLAGTHMNLASVLLVGAVLRLIAGPLIEFSGLLVNRQMLHLRFQRH